VYEPIFEEIPGARNERTVLQKFEFHCDVFNSNVQALWTEYKLEGSLLAKVK
jgi:hypothetical protein